MGEGSALIVKMVFVLSSITVQRMIGIPDL